MVVCLQVLKLKISSQAIKRALQPDPCAHVCVCARAHAHVLGEMEKGTRNITKNRGRRLKSHNKKRLNAGMQENYAKSNIFHSTL